MTIGLVIARPRGLTEARAAVLGAGVMVVAGLVSPGVAASNIVGHWNVLLFFVGLTGAAAVAERSGLFDAVAGTSARLSGGRPRRLLVAVVMAGAIVAALLSNDAAALLLTPVVYVLVARFGLLTQKTKGRRRSWSRGTSGSRPDCPGRRSRRRSDEVNRSRRSSPRRRRSGPTRWSWPRGLGPARRNRGHEASVTWRDSWSTTPRCRSC